MARDDEDHSGPFHKNEGSEEVTGTLTDLNYNETDREREKTMRELLGARPLEAQPIKQLLLMPNIQGLGDREPLLEVLIPMTGHESLSGPVNGSICLAGPVPEPSLMTWAQEGRIRAHDRVQIPFSRWKRVGEEFPEMLQLLEELEAQEASVTKTMEQELPHADMTRTTELQVEEISTASSGENISGLELEEVPDEAPAKGKSTGVSRPKVKAPSQAKGLKKKLDVEEVEAAAPARPTPAPAAVAPPRRAAPPPASRHRSFALPAIGLVAVGALAYWYLSSSHGPAPTQVTETHMAGSGETPGTESRLRKDVPEKLRARGAESLNEGDTAIMRRIRPILRAYEAGSTLLAQDDEQMLLSLSDPASSNWEARKVASNMLAVFYMSRSEFDRAHRVLDPILQAAPQDPQILLNAALLYLAENKLSNARETAGSALRLGDAYTWLAHCILGMIEGAAGRLPEAERQFGNALSRSPNNPLIYGIWLQTIRKHSNPTRNELRRLVWEAAWTDPDFFLDSPIPAPVAGNIIRTTALEGLVAAAQASGLDQLSSGKMDFLRWMQGRATSFNPLAQPLDEVMRKLALEDDPQSQLLYAYGLKEQRRFDEAAAVLLRVLPLVETQHKISSSWPWTMAGDVQFSRFQFDQAILYYNSAINRNNLDAAAVYGLALVLRERGSFDASEQRLAEVLSINRLFVPARLRIPRFDWQARQRGQ
jgi:tetratricopeptide (TPR) repeat protein